MKYRIMVAGGGNTSGFYKFLTFTNEDGVSEVYETESLTELDAKVERMINGNYKKKDLLVVSPVDFEVFANIAENTSGEASSTTPNGEEGNGEQSGVDTTDNTETNGENAG